MKNKDRKLTYISLFSGAGVGCFGFRSQGFDCVITNEILEKRLNIQKYNRVCKYESGYLAGDMKDEEVKKLILEEINLWKKKEKIKEIDVVIATPPCQGMSVANHKKNNEKKRNSLVVESIMMVNLINPKFFIFENVRSFMKTTCTDSDGVDRSIQEAIELNLGGKYNVLFKIVNFKDYGNNSSRTRAIVIGTRKDLQEITPYDVFPDKANGKILRKTIGYLPALLKMGEVSKSDIFHSFRPYKIEMLEWIKDLKEGESAFDNKNPLKRPHRRIRGEIIPNRQNNGDKYKRCEWNKIAPCVHTRNDILASQSTIHPRDNRVFSIRELMGMMTIPKNFKWFNGETEKINSLNGLEKQKFLFREELNIRQCIGEAVPTVFFEGIAKKIKESLTTETLNHNDIKKIIAKKGLDSNRKLLEFLKKNLEKYTIKELFKIAELGNTDRANQSAFYTKQDVCFSLIKGLPKMMNKKTLRILEPSVGVGNFLPLIMERYEALEALEIDVVDINNDSLEILKTIVKKIKKPKNVNINYINADFLLKNPHRKYDIVVGNPPFGKINGNKELIQKYKDGKFNKEANNICSFFLEKSLEVGKIVALILPKSILSSPKFNKTRELISKKRVLEIIDYGETAFDDVKIETIGIIVENKKNKNETVKTESFITKKVRFLKQSYVTDKKFPMWLIYRNVAFDKTRKKLKFGIFSSFRDRKITKKHTKPKGNIRVLKSRNIGNNEVINIKNYDSYINKVDDFPVKKFLNKKLVLIPNLTYYPRACFMPKNTITDGSVAILTPLEMEKIGKKDLDYYSSKEFKEFYRISQNLGTRSLNIDKNSVYFFGKLKQEI